MLDLKKVHDRFLQEGSIGPAARLDATKAACVLRGPGHVFERANDRYFELLGRRDIIGREVRAAVPEADGQGFFEILEQLAAAG